MKNVLDVVAREYGTTPQDAKCEIMKAVAIGMQSDDAAVQEQWKRFDVQNEEPTLEDVLKYIRMLVLERVTESQYKKQLDMQAM